MMTELEKLAAEIDALRADFSNEKIENSELIERFDALQEERNALELSRQDQISFSKGLMAACDSLREERDKLKAENEKLKNNQVFEASCTHLFEENQKLREHNKQWADDLHIAEKENHKLRSRIENLREALTKYTFQETYKYCARVGDVVPIGDARDALAQDAEMDKKE